MGSCGTKVAPEPAKVKPNRALPATKPLATYADLLRWIIPRLPEKTPDVRVEQIGRVAMSQACAERLREDIRVLGYTDVRFSTVTNGKGLLIYVGLNTEVSLTKEIYPPPAEELQTGRSCMDSSQCQN